MFFFKIVWVISFFIKIVQGGKGGGGGRRDPAHYFEKFSSNFYLSKFH